MTFALFHIVISTPEEAKMGPKNHVSCCPICAYMVQNDYSFLNHIIVGHYWSSFSCRKCLKFVATTGQQMKRHILGCGKPQKKCKRKHSSNAEAHSSPKSGLESKKAKKKSDEEGVGMAGQKKPCSPPTKSSTAATSQEQALNTLHCSVHKATSVSGHLQMPKKREKL